MNEAVRCKRSTLPVPPIKHDEGGRAAAKRARRRISSSPRTAQTAHLGGVGADAGALDGLARGGAALGVAGAEGLDVHGRAADERAVLGASAGVLQGAGGGGGHA